MKNFIKILTKTLSLALIVVFASLPFTACSKNKSANKTSDKVTIENISDSTTNTENEETIDDAVSNEDAIKNLNGIYKITNKITYKDTWYENEKEVIEFFETRDINGVYNALRKINFEEIANSYIYTENETTYEIMLHFYDSKINPVTQIGNTNSFINTEAYYNPNDVLSKIEFNEDGTITVYNQLKINDVATPIFVKYNMQLIEGTQNILTGKTYNYKTNSSKIEINNESATVNGNALNALAIMFGIDENIENKSEAIVSVISNWTFMLSDDYSKITVINNDGSITYANLIGNIYTIKNASFSLTNQVIELDTNTDTLYFTIIIDQNTTFTFNFVA